PGPEAPPGICASSALAPRWGSQPTKGANLKHTAVSIIGPSLSAKFCSELAFVLFEVSERAFVAKEAFLRIFGRLTRGAEFGNKGALVCYDLAGYCQSRGRYDQKRMTARHHGLQHGKEKARHPAGRPPKANTTNLQTCGRAVMAVVCG